MLSTMHRKDILMLIGGSDLYGPQDLPLLMSKNCWTTAEKTLRLLAEGSNSRQFVVASGSSIVKPEVVATNCPYIPAADQLRINNSGQLMSSMEVCESSDNNNEYSKLKDIGTHSMLLSSKVSNEVKSACYVCRINLARVDCKQNCSWCERMLCRSCQRVCLMCSGIFCHVCSTVNYDEHFERTFCLQCRAS